MVPLLTLLAFGTSLFFFQILFPLADTSTSLNFFFGVVSLYSLIYVYILKNIEKPPPIQFTIPVVLIVFLLCPNLLQNDQFRYVWDGANSFLGVNPFKYAPSENPLFKSTIWAQIINHPDLRTIYPPLAQLFFWISHVLNPVFWFEDFNRVTNLHLVVLGLKVTFALYFSIFIYIFRNERWHLIICNPLFLYTVIANNHLDALLIMPLCLILRYIHENKNELATKLSITAMILIKVFPLILLPSLLLKNLKTKGLSRAISNFALVGGLTLFSSMIFYKGISNEMFSSLLTFGKEWFFNGYFHLIFGDILSLFIDQKLAYSISKVVSISFAFIFATSILLGQFRAKLSTQNSIIYILLTYFIFTPTLMPWYLLPLLSLTLFYEKVPTLFWLWPVMSLTSKAYFYDFSDPIVIRYISYTIVTIFLIKYIVSEKKLMLQRA